MRAPRLVTASERTCARHNLTPAPSCLAPLERARTPGVETFATETGARAFARENRRRVRMATPRASLAGVIVILIVTLATGAHASECAPPTFTCAGTNPTIGSATRCHASWTCDALCSARASCVQQFSFASGDATTPKGARVRFNVSSDASALGPTTFGGDASCSAIGCDAYATRITMQNAELTRAFSSDYCEVKETSQRCALSASAPAKDVVWSEVTVGVKCRNAVLPCRARVTTQIDFLGVVSVEPSGPPAPPSPAPPSPAPNPPPNPPAPPTPPPPPAAFAPGGRGRAMVKFMSLAVAATALAYACFGYAYVYALQRGWVEGVAEPCWSREGSACEMLWCWCLPWYWRATDEECIAAYEGRETDAERGDFTQTRAPLLGSDSESDSD